MPKNRPTIKIDQQRGLLDDVTVLDLLGLLSPEKLTAIFGEPTSPMTAYAADIDREAAYKAQDRINKMKPQKVLSNLLTIN